jgi:formate dehydrogenase maturation protein FdhE
MDSSLIFDIATVSLLVIVALELYLVIVALARLPATITARDEKKDQPTINVNVGTVPQAEIAAQRSGAIAAEAEASQKVPAAMTVANAAATIPAPTQATVEPEPVPKPEPQAAPPPSPPKARSLQSTASGLLVLKCPKCQAENSTYRGECFNCGNALHPSN